MRTKRRWPPAIGVTIALLLLWGGAAATAQNQADPSGEPNPPCRVSAIDVADGSARELRASCRGQGIILGRVADYEVMSNQLLKATLVDVRAGGDRRVLLLTVGEDGRPLVEDLTGQIAMAMGRGPMSDISGIELDFADFTRTGEIGIQGGSNERTAVSTRRISIDQQIAQERARREGATQN